MDPISFSIELEIGAMLIAGVAAVATWLHDRHSRANRRQYDRQHRESQAAAERRHREQLVALSRKDSMTLLVEEPETPRRPARRHAA